MYGQQQGVRPIHRRKGYLSLYLPPEQAILPPFQLTDTLPPPLSRQQMLRFGGTLVCVGMPEGEPQPIGNAFPAKMVFKGITIASTAVGNRKDAIEVLDFAARGTFFREQ